MDQDYLLEVETRRLMLKRIRSLSWRVSVVKELDAPSAEHVVGVSQ